MVRISVKGANPTAELESLGDWLRGEPELAGRVRVAHSRPDPSHLGSLTDALIVAVGAGGALSVLASSLKTWLTRPRGSDIQILIHEPDGHEVMIDARRVRTENVESILRQALREDR